MMILFILVIAVVLYFLFRDRDGIKIKRRHNALEILKERLARGEITAEEYEKLKKALLAE